MDSIASNSNGQGSNNPTNPNGRIESSNNHARINIKIDPDERNRPPIGEGGENAASQLSSSSSSSSVQSGSRSVNGGNVHSMYQETIDDLKAQIAELKEELQKERSQVEKLEDSKKTVTAKLLESKDQFAKQATNNADLEKKLASEEELKNNLNKELEKMKKQISALEKENREKDKAGHITITLEEPEEIQIQRDSIKKYEEELKKSNESVAHFKRTVEETEEKLKDKSATVVNLQKTNLAMQMEIDMLKESFKEKEDLETEFKKLQDSVKELEIKNLHQREYINELENSRDEEQKGKLVAEMRLRRLRKKLHLNNCDFDDGRGEYAAVVTPISTTPVDFPTSNSSLTSGVFSMEEFPSLSNDLSHPPLSSEASQLVIETSAMDMEDDSNSVSVAGSVNLPQVESVEDVSAHHSGIYSISDNLNHVELKRFEDIIDQELESVWEQDGLHPPENSDATNPLTDCSNQLNSTIGNESRSTKHGEDKSKLGNFCLCGYEARRLSTLRSHIKKHAEQQKYACQVCNRICFSSSQLSEHYRRTHKITLINSSNENKNHGKKRKSEKTLISPHNNTEKHKERITAAINSSRDVSLNENNNIENQEMAVPSVVPQIPENAEPLPNALNELTISSSSIGRRKINPSTPLSPRNELILHSIDLSKATLGHFCICGKESPNKSALVKHIHTYIQTVRFPCTYGDCKEIKKKFKTTNKLAVHMKEKHKIEYKRTGCLICGKTFLTREELVRHQKIKGCSMIASVLEATQSQKTNPQDNGATSSSQAGVGTSITHAEDVSKTRAGKKGTGIFFCTCGKTFSSRRQLSAHIRSINEPFSPFAKKRKHSKVVHSNGAGTVKRTSKQTGKHDGEFSTIPPMPMLSVTKKKHEVDISRRQVGHFCICGTRCASRKNLNTHIMYFTSEWKFKCHLCTQPFLYLAFLRKHMFAKHKILDVKQVGLKGCKDCTDTFPNHYELSRHRRSQHMNHAGGPEPDIALPNDEDNSPSTMTTQSIDDTKPPPSSPQINFEQNSTTHTHASTRMSPECLPERVGPSTTEAVGTVTTSICDDDDDIESIPENEDMMGPSNPPHGVDTSKGGFVCYCGQDYLGESMLLRHIKRKAPKFFCKSCKEGFMCANQLSNHMLRIHKIVQNASTRMELHRQFRKAHNPGLQIGPSREMKYTPPQRMEFEAVTTENTGDAQQAEQQVPLLLDPHSDNVEKRTGVNVSLSTCRKELPPKRRLRKPTVKCDFCLKTIRRRKDGCRIANQSAKKQERYAKYMKRLSLDWNPETDVIHKRHLLLAVRYEKDPPNPSERLKSSRRPAPPRECPNMQE